MLNLNSLYAFKFHWNLIIPQTASSLSLIYIIQMGLLEHNERNFSVESRDNNCNELCIQNETEKKLHNINWPKIKEKENNNLS